ncbi:4-(cytidine 5'-diphospho)-2-C-methyl-D-erythritol kinase, partial [bacterium]|nr:4-(cytidine 5'-diphospho)-2-C-methyl-D-erythritol kinase [bacterium]MBU1024444.1 4-(cytidine 5'-diphospho)-2-C-methyl-D-erythritol kinase [bacterium]
MAVRKITIQSRAKLNLILKVMGRRPDGFHNIQSVFQSIDLADKLTFSLESGRTGISIRSINPDIPLGNDNLITKAFYKLAEIRDIPVGKGVVCD